MGNLCSKRNSDSISIKSEGKRDSLDTQENHSQSSKRPSQQNGANPDGGGAGDGVGDASGPGGFGPHGSNLQKDVLRSRLKNVEPSSVSGDSMSLSSPTAPVAPTGLARGGADGKDPFALPQEIRKQSDNVKNLLFGRVGKIKGIEKRRKITLYISAPSSCSSTTSSSQDFHHEKEQFHSRVYEPLHDFCSSHGYELHMVDLHWNNDALILEEMQGGDLLHLSLHQLSRQLEVSHVVPVIFLSNNLGPAVLPKSVEQQDFESSSKSLNNESVKKNLVSSWYTLDSQNQPACYRLKPISANIPTIISNKEEGMKEWHQVETDLLNALLQMFSPERRDVYLSSIIEQEIRNMVFVSREQAKRSIWVQRVFTHIQAPTDQQVTPLEAEQSRRLESLHTELKNQLSTEHIMRLLVKWQDGGLSPAQHPEHSQYLDGLTRQLTTQLQTIISQIIDDDDENATWKSYYGLDGSLCSELMLHTLVCQQTSKCPPGVETILSRIKSYIENMEIKHPLVLTGSKGCGKTSILSLAIQHCSHWFPDALILFRFGGLTSESRSLVQILRTLTSQLAYLLTGRNYWIPHKSECYQGELYKLLSSMTSPPLVVVLIDGLDELNPYEAASLGWLSEALPSHLRLIISTASDGSSSSVFQSVQANIRQDDAFLTIPPLSQHGAESLLTEFIVKGGTGGQSAAAGSDKAEVQKKLSPAFKNSTLPLYIKVLAWLASVDRTLDVSGIKDLNSAVTALFDQLESIIGKDKVGKSLQLLCTARYGLQDSEHLDLLSNLPNFTADNLPTWAIASIFLARLRSVLDVFLSWGVAGNAVVTRFRDATIFEAAKARYVGSSTTEGSKILLTYFQESSKAEGESSGPNYACNRHRRRLEEVPVHHLAVHGSIRNDFLCNVDWLIQKLCSSSVYYVLEDMIMETKGDFSKDPDLSLLFKTLQLSASALSYDGRQFFGQIFGRLQSIYGPTPCEKSVPSEWESGKCVFMEKLYEMSQKPCVPSFLPISPFLNGPAEQYDGTIDYQKSDSGEVYFNEIMRMKVSNQYVVSLATAKEEVTVWDVYAEKPVRVLKGVMSPNSLKIIDEHRCVILCGRELHIFNLDDGTFVTKLKGVMNQKMPFFGLHDSNHIVALSRNRMYVNLMNLESGDCVTTFKVGEDRFLNSLIVSDNGKILVCGDETQKPFPLLVWDLTSRKLLYDLRIPHHEFITSLSAITKEGHFVCCVCREVDDPGPNFIVVYDLQSGTLFKKWKPGCNTQAIAISAQGGCVINAVEDNRVLVWDLVTGACQWSLQKHTAPVDILSLDQRGSRCLSCDSTGRDRTVCLWDLTSGTLLALFTPDISFTASEVTNDGEGVILGLKGRKDIVTLLYRDNVSVYSNRVDEKFGANANQGKVTDLKSP